MRPDSRDNLQELVLTQEDARGMASVAQALQGALTKRQTGRAPPSGPAALPWPSPA